MAMASVATTTRVARWLAAQAALFCLVGAALAATELQTAAQEATEPKFIPDTQGAKPAVVGLCIDIMRAIEKADPSLVFTGDQAWQPLVRVEAGVTNGQLDAACAFLRNRARESKFTFVEPALFTVNYRLVVAADDDVQIRDWDDVRKLGSKGVVLVIHGFGMVKRLEEIGGLSVDSGAKDSQTNLRKLLAGRGRFYIHRSPGIESEIRQASLQDKVKLLPAVLHAEKFHMVLAKKVPAEVVEKVRAAIAQLERSGELARLFSKWNTAE